MYFHYSSKGSHTSLPTKVQSTYVCMAQFSKGRLEVLSLLQESSPWFPLLVLMRITWDAHWVLLRD